MNNGKRVPFAILTLVFLSIACKAVSPFSPSEPQLEATSASPDSEILFSDDFSEQSSGWDSLRDEDGITDYDQGGYRIKVEKDNFLFWSNPGLTFSDVRVQADVTKLGGPEENEFGLICRYNNADDFYYFLITSDGYYGISKVFNGEESLIGMENLRESSVINQGQSTNHMIVECEGNTLRLFVNDQLLAEVTDSDLSSGDVGLIAGTYDTPGTDILFDNVIVSRP